ncbi:hypothetical protein GGR54DRAFT_645552 [Hypoxylon sp. NC1633]|nr:hypothetical protein GGR54DRAFT_645552 [Hypoxylon sp. NC1633]
MLIVESSSPVTGGSSGGDNISVLTPEDVEDETPRWKGKGKAAVAGDGTGLGPTGPSNSELTVDWTQYDPPAGLRDLAESNLDIVTEIVLQSIDRVKARIVEDEQRREAEEEAERRRQEENPKPENEKDESTDISNTTLGDDKSSEDNILLKTLPQVPPANHDLLTPGRPSKPKKHSFMKLFRRLNNSGERGESSATGAARYKRDMSSSSIELRTRLVKKLLVPEVSKNATSYSISTPTPSVHEVEVEVECVSCLDDFSPKEMIKGPCHSYCRPCFLRLINVTCENEQQWPPKCCLNPIPDSTIVQNVDDGLKRIYQGKAAEWNIPVSERVYCSQPTCSIWVRPDQIDRARNLARCSAGHRTCTFCRGCQHIEDTCPQDTEMIRTEELAYEEGWKRCYGCHAFVEHKSACQHITCRCGAQFCYVCGARWRTCECTMSQLDTHKRDAVTRRQARIDRENFETAEIMEALRLVREFQREEARKAELLRQERERIAEERRHREIEERVRREEERRRAVEVKFQEYREVFSNIHELQRILVQREHSKEETRLTEEGLKALQELQEKQVVDREKMIASAQAKISKREATFERELAARIAEERRIEEQYHAKLELFWSNKKNGEAKMEASMKELKRKMDDGFKSWGKWRDSELDYYRWSIREQQDIREELMVEAERRLVASSRQEQDNFSLRKVAELRWVDVVMEERERMLTERETIEIEHGEDLEDIEAWFNALEEITADDMDVDEAPRVPVAVV